MHSRIQGKESNQNAKQDTRHLYVKPHNSFSIQDICEVIKTTLAFFKITSLVYMCQINEQYRQIYLVNIIQIKQTILTFKIGKPLNTQSKKTEEEPKTKLISGKVRAHHTRQDHTNKGSRSKWPLPKWTGPNRPYHQQLQPPKAPNQTAPCFGFGFGSRTPVLNSL